MVCWINDNKYWQRAPGLRPQLEGPLRFLRDGDTLFVQSMDRLARNLDDVRSLLTRVTTTGVRIEFLASCGGPAGFRRRKDSCDVVITGEGSINEQRLA